MEKNKKKIISIIVIIVSVLCMGSLTYAHSGKTDSKGGHKDNKNKSGLGSYHYHCGGYEAHLHPDGVCPYSSNASSKSSTSNSSKLTSTEVEDKPATILASEIKIVEENINMEVGESKKLTASITPDNATDKNITWKSSDENIILVDESGKISAIGKGKAIVTASTSNDKTDTVTITVEEKESVNNVVKMQNTQMSINNEENNNSEDGNAALGLATMGALGGGGYWVYKKFKK